MTYRATVLLNSLVSGDDESACRGELQQLSVNNLVLNIT